MTTMNLKLRSALVALCLAACNGSLGDMTDTSDETSATGASGNTSSNSNSGGEQWTPCSAANACPDGQFCFNGLCAIGCQSDGDCADNQYCATDDDMLCHNKQVTTCPEVPCAEGQVCVNGFCSTPPPPTQCTPNTLPDGCESNALCIEEQEGMPKCHSFPYCAEDGTCPTGTHGAVCNDGLIAEKDKICLSGLCTDVSNCPTDWKCIKFEANAVVGVCSSGGVGNVCSSSDDCLSGNCSQPLPGVPGVCL